MNRIKKYKILKVAPDAKESEDHIVTAYLMVKSENELIFWCDIPHWRLYFPYYPKPSKWGTGQKLINNLIGKEIELELSFVDLETIEKIDEKKKEIRQDSDAFGSADCTKVTGQIVEKEEYNPKNYFDEKLCPNPTKFERLIIDCGVYLTTSADKGKFKVGDFIKGKGILNAEIIGEPK